MMIITMMVYGDCYDIGNGDYDDGGKDCNDGDDTY